MNVDSTENNDDEKPSKIDATPINDASTHRSLSILVFLAIAVTLYGARTVLAPIVVALVLSFLFKPMVRRLEDFHVPNIVSGFVIVSSLFIIMTGPVLMVIQSAAEWVDDAPQHAERIEKKLNQIGVNVPTSKKENAEEAADPEPIMPSKAAPTTEADENDDSEGATANTGASNQFVSWFTSTSLGPLMQQTRYTIVTILFTLLLLFFLLASGDTFLRRVLKLMPDFRHKRNVVEALYEIEAGISSFLFTLTMINMTFGTVAAIVFWYFDAPNPFLWGLAAALCNFVPYIGPIMFWLIFTPVCLLHYDNPVDAIWAPLVFIFMNLMEGYIISPHIYGKRMSLHPLVVFVGIAIFGWLWGLMGALLAVPLLVCFHIICKHVDGLNRYAVLLSGDGDPLKVNAPLPPGSAALSKGDRGGD